MRVGLFYELHSDYVWRDGDPPDADAEFEPEETLVAVEDAFRLLGHQPVRVGDARTLLRAWDSLEVDAAFNISEGAHSRNREAYVPVLLELAGVPLLGSDALTLSISLDKAATKDLAAAVGVATPAYRVLKRVTPSPHSLDGLEYPLIVKPRYEGSAKGLSEASVVHDYGSLQRQVAHMMRMYEQDVLVEQFISGGGEFTVSVIGNGPPEILPVLQRAVEKRTGIGLHVLERRGQVPAEWEYEIPGDLSPHLEERMADAALRIYEKLECRDFARVDFRVDREGVPWFLEINPLPTFAPDGTFAVVAELMGMTHVQLLASVFEKAFQRLQMGGDAPIGA